MSHKYHHIHHIHQDIWIICLIVLELDFIVRIHILHLLRIIIFFNYNNINKKIENKIVWMLLIILMIIARTITPHKMKFSGKYEEYKGKTMRNSADKNFRVKAWTLRNAEGDVIQPKMVQDSQCKWELTRPCIECGHVGCGIDTQHRDARKAASKQSTHKPSMVSARQFVKSHKEVFALCEDELYTLDDEF